MAEKIRVNTGSLSKTKEAVQRNLDQIKTEIRALNTDIRILNGMWEGPAHTVFHTSCLADVRNLSELCGVLKEIVSFEENAIKEYDSCERQVSSLIDGIKV